MVVVNDSSSTCNFYIDVFDENSKSERCILFNTLSIEESVALSEIGPGGIMSKREAINLRPFNYAYKCPGYFIDNNFLYGNPTYISLDGMVTWTSVGTIITDLSETTYLTNESSLYYLYPYVYAVLDLGDTYYIENVEIFSVGGETGWSGTILYSRMDTDNPGDIPSTPGDPNGWSSLASSSARWIQFQAPAVNVGGPSIRYFSYAVVTVSLSAALNYGKVPWKSANGKLTNGAAGYKEGVSPEEGWIFNGQSSMFCVNLGWWHNVTNVITGPFNIGDDDIDDVDELLPGTLPSIVDASGAGANVAYATSSTDDPVRVKWGNFGSAPVGLVKWVAVKVEDSRVEEIIVCGSSRGTTLFIMSMLMLIQVCALLPWITLLILDPQKSTCCLNRV
jgi:hypothetical protein